MSKRFFAGPQSGDPLTDELIRALEDDRPDPPPRLIGTTTSSGANTEDRKASDPRNPMSAYGDMVQGGKAGVFRRVPAATAEGMILVSYLDGSGNMQLQFVAGGTVGFDVDDILVNADGEVVVSADGFVLLRS